LRRKQPPIRGLITTSLQLPEIIHEDMKVIQQVRREIEKGDVKLCRLYREAVEYWLAARPQREQLERHRAQSADARPDSDQEGILCAG
jgi:hypothetical protein